jgi:hypothetical protein
MADRASFVFKGVNPLGELFPLGGMVIGACTLGLTMSGWQLRNNSSVVLDKARWRDPMQMSDGGRHFMMQRDQQIATLAAHSNTNLTEAEDSAY